MAFPMLKNWLDNRQECSIVNRFRIKRFQIFADLLAPLPRPLRILDVGGTQVFWEQMGFVHEENVEIVLLNLSKVDAKHANFASVVGDARDLKFYEDGFFDVVFSNSVIEHVGNYDQQKQMVQEMVRVGRRYFVQTPNRNFPIEPHFMFPFFQFLPMLMKLFIIRKLWWFRRIDDKRQATEAIESIRLLNRHELLAMFPEPNVCEEKLFGLTKSFMVYGGW
jgi:2-polyprenyl-3-methyl-5-hydroxy-6-metoxy-1,4-benzoquinol methylase